MSEDNPEDKHLEEVLLKRQKMISHANAFGIEEDGKAEGYLADGFGSMLEYLQSGYVEVLDFYGDISDEKGNLLRNRHVVVIDRHWVIKNDPIPNWLGSAPICHVGWRKRPDNLWAMGPLDNLVGMQYRIDHLENAKADAYDLAIQPPLKIVGDVEEFEWGPSARIYCGDGGDVQEDRKSVV